MQRFLILLIVLAAGVAGWWYFFVLPKAENTIIETPLATSTPAPQWQWQFDSAGEDPQTGIPKTNVTLKNGGTSYSIGATEGTCFDIAQSDWKLLTDQGELAGAICYWAGGGSEIGVFSEDGNAVVKIGDVDEGTAETPGVRGNFRTLFSIEFGFITAFDATARAISFDNALWLFGAEGENAAIAAGLCTEETRGECLPNDFYIYNEEAKSVHIPLADSVAIYMVTWNAADGGVKRQFIKIDEFAKLINDPALHWSKLPYNVTIKNGEVIMIEEVYVP